MNVAAFPNPSGSRFWRLEDPFAYLRRAGHDARVIDGPITDAVAQWADIVVLQSIVDREGIALLVAYQQERGLRLVLDVDDWLTIDEDNPHKAVHQLTAAPEVIKITLARADLVTTTTATLAKELKTINPNVVVLPNAMDMTRWQQPVLPNDSGRIRIGWTGSVTHLKDLAMLREPLAAIAEEFPQVEFVFMGDPRARELFPTLQAEYMLGVPFVFYPARLAGLRLDIGLAPLRDTPFNRARSPIKWYEYALNNVATVCSPVAYGFRGFDGNFGLLAETPDQWYQCIKNLIVSRNLRTDITRRAHAFVRANCDLKTAHKAWITAYEQLFS